jgi:hypothetical protein
MLYLPMYTSDQSLIPNTSYASTYLYFYIFINLFICLSCSLCFLWNFQVCCYRAYGKLDEEKFSDSCRNLANFLWNSGFFLARWRALVGVSVSSLGRRLLRRLRSSLCDVLTPMEDVWWRLIVTSVLNGVLLLSVDTKQSVSSLKRIWPSTKRQSAGERNHSAVVRVVAMIRWGYGLVTFTEVSAAFDVAAGWCFEAEWFGDWCQWMCWGKFRDIAGGYWQFCPGIVEVEPQMLRELGSRW